MMNSLQLQNISCLFLDYFTVSRLPMLFLSPFLSMQKATYRNSTSFLVNQEFETKGRGKNQMQPYKLMQS